jgi:hypothetical protein
MPRRIDNDNAIEQIVPLRALKAGTFFRRIRLFDGKYKLQPDASKVYVRGEYIPGKKKFSCTYYDDVNRETFLVGTTPVFVGFCF